MPPFRTRLLRYFLAYSVLSFGAVVFLSLLTNDRQKEASDLARDLKVLQQLLYENSLHTKSFLLHDARQVSFHATHKSIYLENKERSDAEVRAMIGELRSEAMLEGREVHLLGEIEADQARHEELLATLRDLLLQRGMEDHGVEGAMRVSAHALEDRSGIPTSEVLMLRRIEKDYIIRGQEKYVHRMNQQFDGLLARYEKRSTHDLEAGAIAGLLRDYRDMFGRMVELDQQIGMRRNVGLLARLNILEQDRIRRVDDLLDLNADRALRTERQLFMGFSITVVLLLLLSFLSAWIVSTHITWPLRRLADRVHELVNSDFTLPPRPMEVGARDVEVRDLADHFGRLHAELHDHIRTLHDKVVERTRELNREKELVELKNLEITDSLRYARGIQESMLNSSRHLSEFFPDSFLLNIPRDIVGGDFLWTHRKQVGGREHLYFAVADCTGHGVPASLMSVMFHQALNQLVHEMHAPSPARMLIELNVISAGFLGHEHGIRMGDGMSISLCLYEADRGRLTFAGSQQSIYVRSGGELIRIKGDRTAISAGHQEGLRGGFRDHQLDLPDGAEVYLFSDGFPDQFGGPRGRKLNARRFRELIEAAGAVPIAHQYKYFQEAFRTWQAQQPQVDDVIVLGVRLPQVAAAVAAGRTHAA